MNRFSRVTQYLLFLLVILIPFSVRYVFESGWNYQTGAYSDFTSLSLYISDLVLILMAALLVFSKPKWFVPRVWKITALITGGWLILELIIQSKGPLPLQAYFSLRVLLLLVLASTVANIHVSREKFAWLFSGLGAIQGLIATFQFYYQKSLGLYFFGESPLGPEMFGVAKIVSHGTRFIRAYGTFPHSNLLSAFLVVSTLFNLYLLTRTPQIPRDMKLPRGKSDVSRGIILYFCLFLNIFGLFLTFSRAGMLGLLTATVVTFGFFLYKKDYFSVSRGIIPAIGAVIVSIAILFPYLTTRATISDNSTKERVFYNQIGSEMVKNEPFIGLGPGTSVLHMKQYAEQKGTELKTWEIQPIHNFYLISWAEWGMGAILLLFLIIYPIIGLFKRERETWNITLISISVSFLVLFLFDHYFYTIWPTQVLLWLIVGLNLNAVSRGTTYDTSSQK